MRHGETESNKKNYVQGQTNESLSDIGIKQVKRQIPYLKKQKITLILSSDLQRAKETAKIISKTLNIKVRYMKILREKNNGRYTGKKSAEINWNNVNGDYEHRKAPKGESLFEVLQRVKQFLDIIKEQQQKEKIIVISHGTFLKLIKGYLAKKNIKKSIENIKIKNGKVMKIKC